MINIQEQVIRGAELREEGKFNFDRKAYLNASEAAYCIRKQWYSKHQPDAEEEQQWGWARRGIHGEKYLVDALRAVNVPIINAWPEQWSMQDDDLRISCTPDGYIAYDDEWLGIEFKTIDPRTNRNYLPKAPHVTQLQICMAMIDKQIDNPGINKGILVYMDASNYDDIIQYEIEADHSILKKMERRANKVLNAKDPSTLDREGKRDGGKECSTMCGFKDICGVTSEATPGKKRANRGSNFDATALRFMELKDQEDAIKAEKSRLSEDIKNELHARQVNKAVVGNIDVSLSVSKGRASLDKKAVAAAGIDLSPFETVGAPVESLTLKRK